MEKKRAAYNQFSDDYIVRIYRLSRDEERGIVGIVETVGVEGRKVFSDVYELWEIMNPRKKAHRKD